MIVLITGATGLVGSRLIETLFLKGYDQIRVLSRNKNHAANNISFPVEIFEWNVDTMMIDPAAVENVDVVIHLAGESVAQGNWNQTQKKKILDSRVMGTKLLIDAIRKAKNPPKKIISSSATGIYGDRGDELLNAESSTGQGFLADVCKQWEAEVLNSNLPNLKKHIIRTGIVLAMEGGALKKMLPPFKLGGGGKLGEGRQYMSWIHIDDLVGQFLYLCENNFEDSIFEGVGPSPVTNEEFTKILGKVLKRPTFFTVPTIALKTIFGEMSQILLDSQRVEPKNFIKVGYNFKFKTLEMALTDILKYETKGESVLKRYQWISQTPEKVFEFFLDEKNLEKITPPYLNFEVLKKSTPKLQEGTLLDYQLKLHQVPLKWQSKIVKLVVGKSFVDEQTKGPYNKWVHTHNFLPVKNGTLMQDTVIYKMPLGELGKIAAMPFVNRDLKNIFDFRKKIIKEIFTK